MPPKRTVRFSATSGSTTCAAGAAASCGALGVDLPRRPDDAEVALLHLASCGELLGGARAARPRRPRARTPVAATSSAIAAFCSTRTTAVPCSLISRMTPAIRSTICGARPSDGSSSSSSFGSLISARPMASICCSPPDSSTARCAAPLLEAREELEDPRLGALARRAVARRSSRRRAGSPRRSARRRCGGPRAPGRCPRARPAPGSTPRRSRPSKEISPASALPFWSGSVPEIARSSVLLPAPLAAEHGDDRPCRALTCSRRAMRAALLRS